MVAKKYRCLERALASRGRHKVTTDLVHLINGDRPSADYCINLFLHLAVGLGVGKEVVESKGEETRGSLVAGNQKSDEIVNDAGVAHVLAGLGVDAVHHGSEEIFPALGRKFLSLPQDFLGGPSKSVNVFKVLLSRLAVEHCGEAGAFYPVSGLDQKAPHGGQERVLIIVVERVEAIVHGAEGERVKGQASEGIWRGDWGRRTVTRPPEHKLARDLVHLREHVLDVHGPKGRHQDAMRDTPVRFVIFCGEKAIVHAVADLVEDNRYVLLEALLVTELMDKGLGGLDRT
jgi:hypothetical protein